MKLHQGVDNSSVGPEYLCVRKESESERKNERESILDESASGCMTSGNFKRPIG